MRILVFAEFLAPLGGVEVQSLYVCRELARRGHEVDVLYVEDGDLRPEFEAACHRVTRVPTFRFHTANGWRDAVHVLPVVRAVVRSRPKVIYLQKPLEIGAAVLAGKLVRAPVVCHLHAFEAGECGHRKGSFVKKFIAVSQYLRAKWVDDAFDADWVEVVHNGVDLADYPHGGLEERTRARRALGLPEEGFIALFYGRLDPRKGVEVLLDAWGQLQLETSTHLLLLVGLPEISLADAAAYARQLQEQAPPGCQWLPGRRDVITPLHAADVVVVPSLFEDPLPRVVIESLATGRPVIAASTGGIPEMLAGEFSRFQFPRADAGALASRLRAVLDWREREPELEQACTQHVVEEFDGQTMMDNIERILTNAAAKA
jgi:glycosyltransferase involved in cell wall biosynthesis